MATSGRIPRDPLTVQLVEEAWGFEFHQAVRLLEAFLEGTPVGRTSTPSEDAIRFRSQVSLSFPASELTEIQVPEDEEGQAKITVAFLGLASATGPLPRPFTEWILERVAKRDRAFRDFLDIFNHRLVSYHYRAREKHRPGLRIAPPEESTLAEPLFALAGLGTPQLRDRTRLADRGLLSYAATLGRPRPLAGGIAGAMEHYFSVPVSAHPFQGRWHTVEPGQSTRLGGTPGGAPAALGVDTMLGTRAWDQEAVFELRAGPLAFSDFLDFLPQDRDGRLPGGERLAPFADMARFQVGTTTQVTLRLLLAAEEVPSSTLTSGPAAPRLGYTSWLGTRSPDSDADEVVILLS